MVLCSVQRLKMSLTSLSLGERIKMFLVNEKVVYPGHGVALISQIVEKNVAGHKVIFYELSFLNKDMTILVPVDNLIAAGIRKLSTEQKVHDIVTMLAQPSKKDIHELTGGNWNKRNKEYQCKLRTGSLDDIGDVYRDLRYIATQKELSFGEKVLLQQTENLLVQEISLVIHMNEDKTTEWLRSSSAVVYVASVRDKKQNMATIA